MVQTPTCRGGKPCPVSPEREARVSEGGNEMFGVRRALWHIWMTIAGLAVAAAAVTAAGVIAFQ
jgi:hypothetical protein